MPVDLQANFEDGLSEPVEDAGGNQTWKYRTDIKDKSVVLNIKQDGPARDKAKELLAAIIKKVKTLGKVEGENESSVKVNCGQTGYYVYFDGENVVVVCYDGSESQNFSVGSAESDEDAAAYEQAERDGEEDYGELESPPADDL